MLRDRLMTGLALLVLLGAIVGCGGDIGQSPEAANTLERTVEETIVVLEQPSEESIAVLERPAEEADVDLEKPAEEANTFTLKGWVTVDAYHYDEATGSYIHFYHDESSNVITTIGLNFIEEHLGIGGTGYDDPAKWISLSNDGGSAAGWTKLLTELDNTNGMGRTVGTYASTGDGVWTITWTFPATGGVTVQTTGLHWDVTPLSDNNLMAANDFTSVTLANGDSLTITWTLTLNP